jgi:hypothetical protein
MRMTRLPVAAVALSAIAAGIVLAGPSHAAAKPCALYPDAAGDTVAEIEPPVVIPAADGDTDITGLAIGTTADSLVGYVKVAALGDRGTYALGDWHEFSFTAADKVVRVFIERLPAPLSTVVQAAAGLGGVYVGEDYTADIVTATYDKATNTVAVSVKLADLEKALGAPVSKAKLTKITAHTRGHYALVYVPMDHLAAPETASYVIGAACTPPVAAAAPPAAPASASPSAEPSASAAPSGSAAPSPKPSSTAKPTPKPTASAAPKKNPGCATAAAASPKPTPAGSAAASADPSASASESATGSAAASPEASASSEPATGASGSASPERSATGVTLRINTTEITACNAPQLSGQVTDVQGRSMAGVEVRLSAKAHNAKAYADFATVRTDSVGQFKISVRPTVHTSYAAAAGSAKSPAVPVRVHTRVVVESPRNDTAVGSSVTLRGRLVPGHVKAPIELGYTQNGSYVVLGRASTDAQGYWVVSGRPARGRHTFTVSTPERTGNLAGRQPITLTVQ